MYCVGFPVCPIWIKLPTARSLSSGARWRHICGINKQNFTFCAACKSLNNGLYAGSQGIGVQETRQVSEKIPLAEIPFVMRALGYYPTEQEVSEYTSNEPQNYFLTSVNDSVNYHSIRFAIAVRRVWCSNCLTSSDTKYVFSSGSYC